VHPGLIRALMRNIYLELWNPKLTLPGTRRGLAKIQRSDGRNGEFTWAFDDGVRAARSPFTPSRGFSLSASPSSNSVTPGATPITPSHNCKLRFFRLHLLDVMDCRRDDRVFQATVTGRKLDVSDDEAGAPGRDIDTDDYRNKRQPDAYSNVIW